ncbi:MAG: hypothetical protein HY821_08390 [Acidobacteria bacterium]|nr:hypothetical protein [Acidobacteriota bacterium]
MPLRTRLYSCCAALCLLSFPAFAQSSTWPGAYEVSRQDSAGTLTLSTPYYTFQHDLKHGAEISVVSLKHGAAKNLLVKPVNALIAMPDGESFQSQNDSAPEVAVEDSGKARIVRVTARLLSANGKDSGIRLRTRYEYRWGYLKLRREFVFGNQPVAIRRASVLSTVLDPSLDNFGYRQGVTEQEGGSSYFYGAMQWRKLRAGAYFDPPLQTRYVPYYLVLANPGIEGIEWFVSDDLSQWDYQTAGKPGAGLCRVSSSLSPLGVNVNINPLDVTGQVRAQGTWTFDSYIGIPILEGHANPTWLHAAFNANGGKWITEERIQKWADSGIRTAHCHNDGDSLGDGIFWRDGSYPPYSPEGMKEYDRVIQQCQARGIQVTTYFSNKQLHPSTQAYKDHSQEWGRKHTDSGELHHDAAAHGEFGALMCMKSGWLQEIEHNIDTVLSNHKLNGVYYDWNVALYCNNPLHVGKTSNGVSGQTGTLALSPTGHWDMDELLQFMEWTRNRVGPQGQVILHTTMTPMFATENFADRVVGMEWGYGRLSRSVPPVQELPLEWNFANARSRGVIGYGSIDKSAPASVRQLLTLETLLTGTTPWPASAEAIALYKILTPLGDLTRYKFQDWRNHAVQLDSPEAISSLYSRSGEAWILIGNTGAQSRQIRVKLDPKALPAPLDSISLLQQVDRSNTVALNATRATGEGESVQVPAYGAVLLRITR